MRRAVGALVVIGLIGGAAWVGLTFGPSDEPSLAAMRFLDKLPDVVGMEMDEAIRELNSVAIDVETSSQGTVTGMLVGTVEGTPAFVVLEGTRPGPHRCPSWFNSCPMIHLDY